MKKQILSIGKELTKSEQGKINGGFWGCSPCTNDANCNYVYIYLPPAICIQGCCVTVF